MRTLVWHSTVPLRQSKVPIMPSSSKSVDLTDADLQAILGDPKSTMEYRILRATRRLLARDGLGVSVDSIAVEANIGRRTIFRYFSTREELIAQALSESLANFHEQVADAISDSSDIDQWLVDVVSHLHQSQRRAGVAFWQLSASRDEDLEPLIAQVNKHRRQSRRRLTKSAAQAGWTKAGGQGEVPRSIELAMALSISSFAVQSLNVDYKANDHESAEAVALMLSALLEREVSS